MKKLILLVFILLNSLNLYAQIDTSVYYPLKTGDYWEYIGQYNNQKHFEYVTVLGDTLMPNQKQYKIVENVLDWQGSLRFTYFTYKRVEDGCKVYKYLPENECFEDETLLYDLSKADSMLWEICFFHGDDELNYNGVFMSVYTYHPAFQHLLYTKVFTSVRIKKYPLGNIDTLWNANRGIGMDWVAKGVGLIQYRGELSPQWILAGAIINGTAYGTFTSIGKENIPVSDYKLLVQAYPNPFNPSTTIKILNTKDSNIDVKIYNMLGQEVTKLYKGYVKDESFTLKFDAGSLPSGTYIVVAKSNYSVSTTKLVLVK